MIWEGIPGKSGAVRQRDLNALFDEWATEARGRLSTKLEAIFSRHTVLVRIYLFNGRLLRPGYTATWARPGFNDGPLAGFPRLWR